MYNNKKIFIILKIGHVVMCRSQPSVAATTTPLAKRENYSKEELLAVFDTVINFGLAT